MRAFSDEEIPTQAQVLCEEGIIELELSRKLEERDSSSFGIFRTRMLGAVVGKALEPLQKGTGMVQVLVTLQ